MLRSVKEKEARQNKEKGEFHQKDSHTKSWSLDRTQPEKDKDLGRVA